MKGNIVLTTSLPAGLINMIHEYSKKFGVPRNKIMEEALKSYFERLKKAEYKHSFIRASMDGEMQTMAEEGLSDYLKILDE